MRHIASVLIAIHSYFFFTVNFTQAQRIEYRRSASSATSVNTNKTVTPSKSTISRRTHFNKLIEGSRVFGEEKMPEEMIEGSKVNGLFDRFVSFDPNVDVLWPGSILVGGEFENGFLTPLVWPLRPMTVTLTGLTDPTVGRSWSFTMQRPSHAAFMDGLQKIVESKDESQPDMTTTARILYQRADFDKVNEAMTKLGINGSYLGASIKSSLESASYHHKTNLAICLTQNYYTASVEYPGSAAEFVPDSEIDRAIQITELNKSAVEAMPVYVAGVTYGRKLLVFVSSSEDREKVALAVEAAASFIVGSAGVKFEQEQKEILAKSELRIIVLGGPSVGFIPLLQPHQKQSVEEFLKAGIDFWGKSGGLPISYVLRSVKTGKVVRMKLVTDISEPAGTSPKILESMSINFHTTSQDKDRGTYVSVTLYEDGKPIAVTEQTQEMWFLWANGSHKTINLTPVQELVKPGAGAYSMVIRLWGEQQTWKFNVSGKGKIRGKDWGIPPAGEFHMGENETKEISISIPPPPN
jgi:hypothetical protein